MQNLVIMVSNPLLIVRELGEALFELSKFTDVVGGVRCLHQFDIFGSFGAILLGGEHGNLSVRNVNISSSLVRILCKVAHFREIKGGTAPVPIVRTAVNFR